MNFYKEELLDHYYHPRNRQRLEKPDFCSGQVNPSCGDSVEMAGHLFNGSIQKLAFTGAGCVISQATASLLTEYAQGKTTQEILHFSQDDLTTLLKIELGPMRFKCAYLSLAALQKGLLEVADKASLC